MDQTFSYAPLMSQQINDGSELKLTYLYSVPFNLGLKNCATFTATLIVSTKATLSIKQKTYSCFILFFDM